MPRIIIGAAASLFLTDIAAADPACGLFQYRATITAVYDGDTVTADVDLGFHTWIRDENFRLLGIDAPEVKGATREQGLRARGALAARVLGKQLIICTVKSSEKSDADKREKYGRYLIKIYDGDELINDWMVSNGYAVRYDGGKRTDLANEPLTLAQSWSCQPRRTCNQIGSCDEAMWYLSNCSWGGRLDRDSDGRPCESLC